MDKQRLHGNFVVTFFATVIAVFGCSFLLLIVTNWTTRDAIVQRGKMADKLVRYDWPKGNTTGRMANGKPDSSKFPAPLPTGTKAELTSSYSDAFRTYTIFNYQVGKPSHKCEILVGSKFFRITTE